MEILIFSSPFPRVSSGGECSNDLVSKENGCETQALWNDNKDGNEIAYVKSFSASVCV